MTNSIQKRYGRWFYLILAIFTFVYAAGVIFMLLAWLGIQSYDPLIWQRDALPLHALVFFITTIGLYGIWKFRKWGVYTLAAGWVMTGILNLVFVPPAPMPYKNIFLAVSLVIVFFLLLLPEWHHLD